MQIDECGELKENFEPDFFIFADMFEVELCEYNHDKTGVYVFGYVI